MVAEYSGTLLLVSHDRSFLDNVVTSTLVFEGAGQVNEYVGGYSDWLRQRRASAIAGRAPLANKTPSADKAPAADKAPIAPKPKPRKLSYKDQRELDALPAAIARLEAEQSELQALIRDPELFRRSPAEAAAAVQKLQALVKEMDAAFARWETLEASA
jgi:ATP-binding cassette subfamily F protein uup